MEMYCTILQFFQLKYRARVRPTYIRYKLRFHDNGHARVRSCFVLPFRSRIRVIVIIVHETDQNVRHKRKTENNNNNNSLVGKTHIITRPSARGRMST